MAKKLISVWLSLTILLFSSISIYADDNVQGDFFNSKVVINGSEVVNYNLEYPFFLYNGSTYIPLTQDMGRICGFNAEMDWESRTLKLLKTETTQKNITNNWTKNNGQNIAITALSDVKAVAYEEVTITTDAAINDNVQDEIISEVIDTPELMVEQIDLGGLPILAKGECLFLPVRALSNSEIFDWDLYYESYYGLCISTVEGTAAKGFWKEAESRYNRGLTNYILRYTNHLSEAYAQDLVFMFKRAGRVHGVDEKLLMAIAHKESTFTSWVVARGGAIGLMQIMPGTGAAYGASAEQLKDPRTNINIGASILGSGVKNYGDTVKALSAYNQGSARVNRGNYSTAYATRILTAYNGLNNYLSSNGYN